MTFCANSTPKNLCSFSCMATEISTWLGGWLRVGRRFPQIPGTNKPPPPIPLLPEALHMFGASPSTRTQKADDIAFAFPSCLCKASGSAQDLLGFFPSMHTTRTCAQLYHTRGLLNSQVHIRAFLSPCEVISWFFLSALFSLWFRPTVPTT